MTANFLSRNCSTACRSQMRKADRWQHSPGSRHWRRQRHSLGSFRPWNKRGHRRSVLLRARNRSSRAECRSPHSKSRHRPTRRSDVRHSSGCKPAAAQQQLSGRATDTTKPSSVRCLLLRCNDCRKLLPSLISLSGNSWRRQELNMGKSARERCRPCEFR